MPRFGLFLVLIDTQPSPRVPKACRERVPAAGCSCPAPIVPAGHGLSEVEKPCLHFSWLGAKAFFCKVI